MKYLNSRNESDNIPNLYCRRPSGKVTIKIVSSTYTAIFSSANEVTGTDIPVHDKQVVEKIMKQFNSSLRFDPSEAYMAYTIRDPIRNGWWLVYQLMSVCVTLAVFYFLPLFSCLFPVSFISFCVVYFVTLL